MDPVAVRPPAPLLSPRFQLIRIFDPHLHCIPSLHVAITCYAWLSLRERVGGRGDGVQELAARAYRGVLQVIRSILLVKQHSLADIGPSLFMVTALFPEYGEQWVVDLAGDLLSLMPGTRAALGVRLRDTVLTDYRELREWSGDSSGPQEAVLSYIRRWSAPGNRPAAQQPPP